MEMDGEEDEFGFPLQARELSPQPRICGICKGPMVQDKDFGPFRCLSTIFGGFCKAPKENHPEVPAPADEKPPN